MKINKKILSVACAALMALESVFTPVNSFAAPIIGDLEITAKDNRSGTERIGLLATDSDASPSDAAEMITTYTIDDTEEEGIPVEEISLDEINAVIEYCQNIIDEYPEDSEEALGAMGSLMIYNLYLKVAEADIPENEFYFDSEAFLS